MIKKDLLKKLYEGPIPDRTTVKKIFKCARCDRFKYESERERGSDACSKCAGKNKEVEK